MSIFYSFYGYIADTREWYPILLTKVQGVVMATQYRIMRRINRFGHTHYMPQKRGIYLWSNMDQWLPSIKIARVIILDAINKDKSKPKYKVVETIDPSSAYANGRNLENG